MVPVDRVRVLVERTIHQYDFRDPITETTRELNGDNGANRFAKNACRPNAERIHHFDHALRIVANRRLHRDMIGHAVARVIDCDRPRPIRQYRDELEINGGRLLVHVQKNHDRSIARSAIVDVAVARPHKPALDIHSGQHNLEWKERGNANVIKSFFDEVKCNEGRLYCGIDESAPVLDASIAMTEAWPASVTTSERDING